MVLDYIGETTIIITTTTTTNTTNTTNTTRKFGVFYGVMEYGFGAFGGVPEPITIQNLVIIMGNVYLNFGGI